MPQTWLLSNPGALETCFSLLPCLLVTKQRVCLESEINATAQPLPGTNEVQPLENQLNIPAASDWHVWPF